MSATMAAVLRHRPEVSGIGHQSKPLAGYLAFYQATDKLTWP
jgi:hypothetical protein